MKLYHSLLYTVCTLVLFCDGKKLESGKTSYKIDTEKAVRMLLSYKFLIVSRGVYNQPDYPRCVCSRLKTVSPVKYNHNLTYLDIYAKGQSELGKRVYRDAFYMVKKEKSTLHFSVVAYMSNHVEDEKVSGSYEVFYANKECFIAGTPLQSEKSNSETLLVCCGENHTREKQVEFGAEPPSKVDVTDTEYISLYSRETPALKRT
uniref:Lipocalin n=1 Tax=Rhipicephalus appendiculatus TaxID=34631 RepID=A0A131YD91_RHIAP